MLTTLLSVVSTVGLPIVAVLNGWLTCFNKDAPHLPFIRRVTPAGRVLFPTALLLGALNFYVLYEGRMTSRAHAAQVEAQLTGLRSQTIRAFTNDLSVRSWHESASIAARMVYLQQRVELMKLSSRVPSIRAAQSLIQMAGNPIDLPPEVRRYHEDYYATLEDTVDSLQHSGDDYRSVLRQAGIDEAALQAVLDRCADLCRVLPNVPSEFERYQRQVGFNPDLAQGQVDVISFGIEGLHDVVQIVIQAEHLRRLSAIQPPIER